jgi:hypothetical protein
MGISVKVSCDQCGVEKLQTNHWYMATKGTKNINLQPLDVVMLNEFSYDVLCGEACVHSFLAQNLASLHTAKP